MKNCVYKYNELTFDSQEKMFQYILEQSTGGDIKPDRMTQQEVVDNIKSVGEKIEFFGKREADNGTMVESHDYEYGGKKLRPVSHLIDERYPYRGGEPGTRGKKAKELGTLFHKTAEDTINALNQGKSRAEILRALQDETQKKWAENVMEMYDKWSDGGKNVVLTEFRVGNISQGVAGTVDLAVVYPDGGIRLYDYKTTSSEYLKEEEAGVHKRRGNNLQLNYYKRMMEVGDATLGMKKMKILGAEIIPVELKIDVDPNDTATLESFSVKGPFRFDDEEIFEYHKPNTSDAKLKFPVDGFEQKKAFMKTSQIPDWKSFIRVHTGIDLATASYNIGARRTANQSQWDEKNKSYFFTANGTNYFYKDPVARHERGNRGMEARLNEIERDHRDLFENTYSDMASELINVINTGKGMNVKLDDHTDERAVQLKMMSRMYRQNVDRAVRANTIPGLQDIGEDVVVVYKGFNPDSGRFTAIDLHTVNNDTELDYEEKLEKGRTILGRYVSDAHARVLAAKAGFAQVPVWKNTRRSAHFLKMGLVAAHLQQNNPGIAIDRLTVGKVIKKGSLDVIGRPVAEVMQQLMILSQAKSGERSVLDISYGADTKIPAMLRDKNLTDPKKYQAGGLEAYLRFAGISAVYDDTYTRDRHNQVRRMRKWLVDYKDNKKLLAGVYSEAGIATTVELVKQNQAMREQMLAALIARQQDIEGEANEEEGKYLDNLEYSYVSRAIMDLSGITDQHTTFKSLNYATMNLITPGMTGIELVDEFIGRMQRTIADMNRRMYKEHFMVSRNMHGRLISEGSLMGKVASGKAADISLPLLEHIEVGTVEDPSGKKVKRPTGRFWPETSDEYKNLTQTQKDYIRWFKEKTYTAMTHNLGAQERENFDKYWDRDMIPHMNPSLDTRFADLLRSDSSEGDYMDKVSNYMHRYLDPYGSKNDYVESVTDSYTKMVDKLDSQKRPSGQKVDKFGDVARMERLGFSADGLAKTSYVMANDNERKEIPITRTMETNLETVLSYVVANQYRQESLSHLVPEFKAVKGMIANANSTRFQNNELLLGYLKNYVEKNLFQKNQVTEEQEKLAKWAMAAKMGSNLFLLDYNIMSQVKNTIAGFYHVASTAIANPSLGKHVLKAHYYTVANFGKINSLMWTLGMSSADTDQLVNGFHTQMGKRGFASSHYKHIINYAGDYYHRSVFMVANMMKDGVIDAFSENQSDGNAWYDYDEDKDERFKITAEMGEDEKRRRTALKKFIKEQLALEGKLDDRGRMTTPYTSYDLQNMKREANEAFEAQNNEDQENFRNTVQGLLFGQFKSWWLQKVKRYAMKGTHVTSAKQLREQAVQVDGKTQYVFTYDGTYMEGIFYTLVSMANAAKTIYQTRGMQGWNEWVDSLSQNQKENLRRILGDFSLLAASIAAGNMMFDDEDEDTAWYYLWAQSSNEINLWSYLTATPIIGTGAAIPSVGIVSNFLENPVKTITKPGFTKVFYFLGDGE